MARQKSPVSTLWRTSYNSTWAKSTLGSLVKKPNPTVTQTLNEIDHIDHLPNDPGPTLTP